MSLTRMYFPFPLPKQAVHLAACLALLSPAAHAFGLDEIYSPNAEHGEMAFELSGAQAFDNDPNKNGAQIGEFTFEAGVTPHLTLEFNGLYGADPGQSMQLQAHEVEARYQITEVGEQWVDVGVEFAYDWATQSQQPDSFELKLLLQKDVGRFTHTANIGFTQNVGPYSQGNSGADYVFLWNTRYRYSETLQPGFEIQSDLGPDSMLGNLAQEETYVGPALYGKLFGALKYQVAYFFGTSLPAAHTAARVLLEYETHF